MMRSVFVALLVLAIPASVLASTVEGARTLVVSEAPEGNNYYTGVDLTIAAPITGDLSAVGASVNVSAPVSGDATALGFSLDFRKPVSGDLRLLGGRIMVDSTVGGDLIAAGGSVTAEATPAFAWVLGGKVALAAGARGPVTIYGSTVSLGGEFADDVRVVASDKITLMPGTVMHGTLSYDAPEQVVVPEGVVIEGGLDYTGKSYLPTSEEAHRFALAGAGIFFLIRILAALIAAGLFAGLFPRFAQAVADRALSANASRFVLLTLLGFGVMVATPVLILLLTVSFAGIGVALVIGVAYILLMLLAYVYAAVIAGAALTRAIVKRHELYWRDAVIGMLAISVIMIVPVVGWIFLLVITAAATGTIVSLFYRFAFPKRDILEGL